MEQENNNCNKASDTSKEMHKITMHKGKSKVVIVVVAVVLARGGGGVIRFAAFGAEVGQAGEGAPLKAGLASD
jgi:hypothetical protein